MELVLRAEASGSGRLTATPAGQPPPDGVLLCGVSRFAATSCVVTGRGQISGVSALFVDQLA